jgi:hypothetical protein
MKVHVYSLCRDERLMLPYYLRHYEPVAERFFVFDDGSTDGSDALLRSHGKVELGRFQRDPDWPGSFVMSAFKFNNEVWKQSRGEADWVVVCNVDEHLYHPDLLGYLERCRAAGITALPAVGYQMIARSFPRVDGRLCDHVVHGARWKKMDKLNIFDPNAISDMNWGPGRHRAAPEGDVVYPRAPELKLLHYRYLGLEYLVNRYAQLRPWFGPLDVRRGYDLEYRRNAEAVRQNFEEVAAQAEVVV